MEGWREGWKDGVNEQLFCSCKQAIQGKLPGEQSFFKVASYSASCLCVGVCVCMHAWVHVVLWVSITFSQADISPHTEKKVQTVDVCLCADSAKCQRFPQVSQVRWRVNSCWLRTFSMFILPGTRARLRHVRRMKCMTVLLFCVKWMTLGRKMPLCECVPALWFYITQTLAIKRLQAFRLYNDLCDKAVFACIIHPSFTMFNKIYFQF